VFCAPRQQVSVELKSSNRNFHFLSKTMSRSQLGASGAHHTVSDEEKKGLVDFVNNVVPDAKLDPNGTDVFERLKDGVILCKLIKAIDATVLKKEPIVNFHPDKSAFQKLENLNAVLEAAPRLGCQIVNVGGHDLAAGTPHLVLGLLWQIVRVGLMRKVAALAKVNMQGEEILLKWVNSHLKAAGSTRTVNNFGSDLQDGVNLTLLLHQLEPTRCSKDPLNEMDLLKRAELVLQNAEKIGCRKFITATDIVKANIRLNTAFMATLFAKYPQFGVEEQPTPKGPSELELLKQENEALKRENATLKEQLDSLKQILSEVEQLRNERTHLQNQLNELDMFKKENAQLKGDIENFRRQMEILAGLQNELERLRKENEQLRSDLTNTQNALPNKEGEIHHLKDMEQKLRNEVEAANKEIEILKNELSTLKQQSQAAEAQFHERIATMIVTHQQEVEEVTKRIRDEDTKKLEEAQQDWHTERATMKKEFEERIENLKKAAEEREFQLKEHLEKENAISTQRMKELEEKLTKGFEERENQMREEYEKRELELTKRLQEIASKGLEERSAELQKTYDEKERRLQEELKDKEKIIQQLKETNIENQKKLNDELERLKKDLGDAKQREKKLRQMMTMPPEREGWLFKKTRNEKLLRRWFLLRGEFLLFYREQHPKNMAKTAGAIFLTDSIVTPLDEESSIAQTGDKKLKFAFQIESKYANRVYVLATSDAQARKDWIESIENMKAWYKALQESAKE